MVIWGRAKVGQGRMVEESSPVLPHPLCGRSSQVLLW